MKKREFIYILQNDNVNNNIIKLGYTSNVFQRIVAYKHSNPDIKLIELRQLTNAEDFERSFHSRHQSIYCNEWYDYKDLNYILLEIDKWDKLYPIDEDVYEKLNYDVHEKINKYLSKTVRVLKLKSLKVKSYSFKYLCTAYNNINKLDSKLKDIIDEEPLIKEAFEKLGFDKIQALKFIRKSVKAELSKFDLISNLDTKINSMLNLSIGQWISSNDINVKLEKIYNDLGIIKVSKVKDILLYGYEYKDAQKRIDKIKVRGVIITNNKFN